MDPSLLPLDNPHESAGYQSHLYARPNPQVQIVVDTDTPFVMCDLKQPDQPIVYATPSFYDMTGYHQSEVIGRNCRFLQRIKKMRKAVERNKELQIKVANYRRNGQKFINMLTIIPICWGTTDHNLSLGFMQEVPS
ncbi:hypothetical protein B0T17DRAFT_589056 [Bombardia bombarda]|uniref:PAS domain-containing protein n=1 Tax=Bombardia bombarda TaxID=252184 RepID=A0AA39X887_9PEZI|nr:hypothetical protein B0T17DRAFT_589056 [Bombardia bombarda]